MRCRISFETLADRGPDMLQAAIELFLKIASGALKALPDIIKNIPKIIKAIVDGLMNGMPDIIDVGNQKKKRIIREEQLELI